MYKCDLCRNELNQGRNPHCIDACPENAMEIGRRDKIYQKALELKEKYQGDIYGMDENGGTSTLYVSSLPFAEIDEALRQHGEGKQIPRLNTPQNMLAKQKNWALLSLASPLVGALIAYGISGRSERSEDT